MITGTVYLIGAGPGDPKLITVRGLEILKEAEVVVYDRLAHPSLLEHVRPDAERVYVGKVSAHHAMKQPEINALLVDRALKGKTVARLKGGDPFVFGRGGEEAEECRAAGVPFQIVPGVTSAIAAAAYAGIPVTHRDAASSFAVITGHERDDSRESGTRAPGAAEGRRKWANIAHAADTLVFLMGVENLPEITAQLREHGRDPATPVALVQWGTWSKQRVVTGNLATITDIVKEAGLTPPAVCIVGEVVRLREQLQWFDDLRQRPLFGKRVVVTRAREQASGLSDLLRAQGAEPLEFPVIRIAKLDDYGALDEALRNMRRYRWCVFTSVNAVPPFAERLSALGLDSRALAGVKFAAIGPATAEAVRFHLGIQSDFVPTEAVAEAVITEWPDPEMQGASVLIPRALEAREILPDELRHRGANVDVIPAYETVFDDSTASEIASLVQNGDVDAITFTSSSTVRNFMRALKIEDGTDVLTEALKGVCIVAIGPVTADTLREYKLLPTVIAAEHTIPGLMVALEAYYRG